MKAAVLIFGFFHGFGLSTKLQDLAISPDGLITNMLSFNVGVELGQLVALSVMLIAFQPPGVRRTASCATLMPPTSC